MALIEKEIYNFKEALNVMGIKLRKIQSESDNQSQVLGTFVCSYDMPCANAIAVAIIASLKKELDPMESKLRSAEGNKQNFVMAIEMDKKFSC